MGRHQTYGSWEEITGRGDIWQLTDPCGDILAEVTRRRDREDLWSFYVLIPERYHLKHDNPGGFVNSEDAAKHICEEILRATVLQT